MKTKTAVTGLLVAALSLCPVRAEPKKDVIPELCIGVIVIGVAVVIGVGICKIAKKIPPLETPPQPPCPPTNSPPKKTFVGPAPMSAHLPDNNVMYYDVTGYAFEQKDPSGYDYTRVFGFDLQSCTNLSGPWRTSCSVTGWVSQAYVITVTYDQGLPIQTNLCGRTGTNTCQAKIGEAQSEFFRIP